MGPLDYSGPLTVFWSASGFMEKAGRPGYVSYTVSFDGGPVMDGRGRRHRHNTADRIRSSRD